MTVESVRDLFEGDRPITGSDCGALRLQRARLMEENERLRKALGLCVASLDQLLPHMGKIPANIGLLNEALCKSRPLLESKQ